MRNLCFVRSIPLRHDSDIFRLLRCDGDMSAVGDGAGNAFLVTESILK